ncbi:MAG: ATP-grasp domain-containing protein [Gammaproteobacteria bacterium]|nr:ATP-grasp domain-containing protein [Gammaproteobacteria bacterium]
MVAPPFSYRLSPYLKAAASLGVEAKVVSQGRHSLVEAVANGLHVDLADSCATIQAIVESNLAEPLDAVIATDDATVELAAKAGRALGLRTNAPDAALLSRRKDLARARLRERGVAVPEFRVLDLDTPLPAQCVGVSFPCVVKPLALSASRGVIRVDDMDALQHACARIRPIIAVAPPGPERSRVLLEAFIPGAEYAVEGLIDAGRLEVLTIFEKPEPLDGPFFEESLYVTPARLDTRQVESLSHMTAKACAAYGIEHGPIHAELRLNQEGPWIVEVAARTIGGECARLLEFGTGVSLEHLVIVHALGLSLPRARFDGCVGVLMLCGRQAGVLRRIEGVLEASGIEHVTDVSISAREGREVTPLPEGGDYLGFVFARAGSPDAVEKALRQAREAIRVVVAPAWKLVPGARLAG